MGLEGSMLRHLPCTCQAWPVGSLSSWAGDGQRVVNLLAGSKVPGLSVQRAGRTITCL